MVQFMGSTSISQCGNYLKALIQVVNKYYSGIFKIIDVGEERYLIELKNNFKLNMLPMNFSHDEFARRLITSLLAKPFVILTGNSGSGKTRIAKQFAEYLECLDANREKNWSLVPVGADWTDNTKVLGFFNPLAQTEKDQYIKTIPF